MISHGVTGDSWNCPHCGERILRNAVICSACHRRLRFDGASAAQPAGNTVCPLTVEGTIRHPGSDVAWEYSVLIEVHDDEGELLARRVVGVGALKPGETRKVTLRIEVQLPEKSTLSADS